ncbi:FUSC family protein [Rhizobium oryzicola]|uniref:FUSC family protein n=1 Tax=Rhizobium oryzicola TaxID=1232668 RepID=A0ABT8T1W9_9HYPH|nr:FUSC family protein [Rhizobium oryzicola]MDO1583882.1 FUSC family protein [Rhizobium oryzicola]
MTSRFSPLDWLLATDPAFTRLRMGARVALTIGLSVLIMVIIHYQVMPLPPVAFGLSIILSIEGGVAVKDATPRAQLITRIFGGVASLACVALAALLEEHRYLSDAVFLLVILLSTLARLYGQRGFAVGMFAFTSYFMGAYLKPPLDELPYAALGPLISVVIGHWVRTRLIPDDRARDLLQALIAVQGRINDILYKLAVVAHAGAAKDGDLEELLVLQERLKDVVLMAEGFLPRPPDGALDGSESPVTTLAMKIFDLHLAAESTIVLSAQKSAPFGLVHCIIEGDLEGIEAWRAKAETLEDNQQREAINALIWLHDARRDLQTEITEGGDVRFRELVRTVSAAGSPQKIRLSLKNAAVRAALQITLASAIAMVFGLMLSRERWFWAVLTAFLVFTNTKSRGDAAVRALQRSVGTVLGIAVGLGLALVVQQHLPLLIVLAGFGIFFAFYFLQVSYAMMTFFVSIVLCLIYSLIGTLTVELVTLRVEETLIGAVAGTAVAFFVLPTRTRTSMQDVLDRWYGHLAQLLEEAKDGRSGFDLIERSRQLDAAYRDLALAARPLGTAWTLVTKPGRVRQTLAIFLTSTYWARIFARSRTQAANEMTAEEIAAIDDVLATLRKAKGLGPDPFFTGSGPKRQPQEHLPIFRHGTRIGIRMIGTMLGRLSV